MSIDKALFMDPPAQYRMNPMIHIWPEHDSRLFMEALKDYGFGGVVTNVYQEDGFTSNPKNLHRFSAIVQELEQSGLPYWVYDESGYPSGSGGGLVRGQGAVHAPHHHLYAPRGALPAGLRI